jgi:hypothetical protein
MPYRLGRNLRKGHLAEDIGMNVLRGFSAVADVRHQDDIGVDAYCVLLRPEKRLLLADDPFSVQFKSMSVSRVTYDEDSIDWFIGLQIPLFFGKVDARTGRVAFYTTSRYRQRLFNSPKINNIVLDFDSVETSIDGGAIVAGLYPPILECEEKESRTDEFACHAFSHLKKWIAFEKRSIELQKFNIHISAKWSMGGLPEVYFEGSCTHLHERQNHMRDALPIIDKLAHHAMGTEECDPKLLQAFIRIFEWYCNEGYSNEDLPIDNLSRVIEIWESQ